MSTQESDQIKAILQGTKKALEKDPSVDLHMAGDVGITSHIPFAIPTGLPELDLHLGGRGGLPAGKMVEYWGFEMCGKTTAALMAASECQRMNGLVLWVDAEQSWSDKRATECGVDLGRIQVASAYTIESIFHVLENFIEQVEKVEFKGPVLLVVDSITGVSTEFEQEKEITKEGRVGQNARQIRRGAIRLVPMLAKTKITAVFINHGIAVIGGPSFGKKSDAAGGHGIKFMSSVRVHFANLGHLKNSERTFREGQKVTLEINKLRNTALTAPKIDELHITKKGFDKERSLMEAGVKTGWIKKINQKTYEVEIAGEKEQFPRSDWEMKLEQLGGYHNAYDQWISHGELTGYIQRWGDEYK